MLLGVQEGAGEAAGLWLSHFDMQLPN